MPISDCQVRDPRIRRTRKLLQGALGALMQSKSFDEISVQDITEAATVNRATFYDHYNDNLPCSKPWLPAASTSFWMRASCATTLAALSALEAIVVSHLRFPLSNPRPRRAVTGSRPSNR